MKKLVNFRDDALTNSELSAVERLLDGRYVVECHFPLDHSADLWEVMEDAVDNLLSVRDALTVEDEPLIVPPQDAYVAAYLLREVGLVMASIRRDMTVDEFGIVVLGDEVMIV